MSLEGKPVIITGAGSGIGRATAVLLGAKGATVVCADVKGAVETADAVSSAGGRADSFELDVRNAAGWQAVVQGTINLHGEVGALANIAGVVSGGPDTVVDQTEDEWQRVLDVDLKGTWLGMRAVLPCMIEGRGGKIVNVASLAGLIGLQNLAAYSAAKGGVISLSRQAAMEYARCGIRINAIAPGIIETPILGDITTEMRATFAGATPLGRLGRPEEIAGMISHLLGEAGDFITGQVMVIDGGWSAQ